MSKTAKVAFAAREGGDELSGGTVSFGDGETLDVVEALEKGGGTIVVDEGSPEAFALAEYPGVKATKVPEGKSSTASKEKE